MIILSEIVLQFGQRLLFDHINLTLQADNKVGVVGRNGTGKSTLFKVITGNIPLDGGAVSVERGKRIAYMPQEVTLSSHKSVFDEAFSVFDSMIQIEKRVHQIEDLLAEGSDDAMDLLEEYSACQEKLMQFDRASALSKTEEILKGLGFSDEQKKQSVESLSVGWRMRVVLAQLLLQEADFYLFDEPTNHLDIVTQEWFLKFLQNARFGYLLITHDRHFLQHACSKILELAQGKAHLYHGNYDYYLKLKEDRTAHQHSAYEQQQKEIARKQKTIDRFKASASKAKMAQSMIKQLDKIERIEIEREEATIRLTFPPAQRSGKVVLYAKDLSHTFNKGTLFKNVEIEIQRGQKIALIAPNGVGKTTLFNLLTEKLGLQTGSIQFGHNVTWTYFEQDQARVLKPKNTVFKEVCDACPNVADTIIRSFLGQFLFSGQDIEKKIEVLSGGERNRVAMVKVLLQQANFLLLDEPTNHLDLYTKDILLQALKQYDGTILIVSHDHAFIQDLATSILELTPQGAHLYPGTYEEFLTYKQGQAAHTAKHSLAPSQPEVSADFDTENTMSNKDAFSLKKTLRMLEKKIEHLEKQRDEAALKFSKTSYGTIFYTQAQEKLEKAQADLTAATAEWEDIAEKL